MDTIPEVDSYGLLHGYNYSFEVKLSEDDKKKGKEILDVSEEIVKQRWMDEVLKVFIKVNYNLHFVKAILLCHKIFF